VAEMLMSNNRPKGYCEIHKVTYLLQYGCLRCDGRKALLPLGPFKGDRYDEVRDGARLTGQILKVYEAVKDHEWRSVKEISQIIGAPENSVQAQLRNLRKEEFGSHVVETKRATDTGLFLYRLVI
jgi:hypothetical protein